MKIKGRTIIAALLLGIVCLCLCSCGGTKKDKKNIIGKWEIQDGSYRGEIGAQFYENGKCYFDGSDGVYEICSSIKISGHKIKTPKKYDGLLILKDEKGDSDDEAMVLAYRFSSSGGTLDIAKINADGDIGEAVSLVKSE